MIKQLVRLMRPHHCVKNVIIFLPPIFGNALFDAASLGRSLLAFLAFSLLASSVYVLNDLRDAPSDRAHPTKRSRPIASGAVSAAQASVLCAVLLAAAVAVHVPAAGGRASAWACFLGYYALNVAYSAGLKRVPIADLAILMSGYLLRLMYGAACTDIAVSGWLYLTIVSIAFYLGAGKRRGELRRTDGAGRAVLRSYTHAFLNQMCQMFMTLSVVFYALWTVDESTAARPNGDKLIWTVPLVLIICMKYALNLEGDTDGDPTEILLHDKILLALAGAYALLVLGILYF